MVVRYSLSVVACAGLVAALGCGGKSDPSSSTVPVITSFTPTDGGVGTTVTLTGTGFDGTKAVSVGGAQVTSYDRQSDTKLTLVVPTTAPSGYIAVANGKGSGGSTTKFYVSPSVDSISPTSGSPGTAVTITGSGLSGLAKVMFGTRAATSFYVTSPNQAQAVVPLAATTGAIVVSVPASTGLATASSPTFTYSDGGITAPNLVSFTPAQATVGTFVTLTGTGFNSVASVNIGGVDAYFKLISDSQINVQVPAAAASGFIQAVSVLGNSSSATPFIVVPAITDIHPAQGPTGTLVTLKGAGFIGATSVKFGNATFSNFVVLDANDIQANVAAGSATGPVAIVSNGVSAASTGTFTYLADPTAAPAITTFTPTAALVGQKVTLAGSGFTGTTSITVGGADAVFTVVSDTQIDLTVPADAATGFIAVTNGKGVAGTASAFTVTPTITGVAPLQGPVGTTVTLTGTGFSGMTTVKFGGGPLANFAVLDANHITTQVPASSTTGVITASSSTSGVSCASTDTFTVTQ
jgi:hypothetical protein